MTEKYYYTETKAFGSRMERISNVEGVGRGVGRAGRDGAREIPATPIIPLAGRHCAHALARPCYWLLAVPPTL